MQLRVGQSGFTLIEVLVAMVVVSIGLLGIVGMQTVGLASTHQSHERSTAAITAQNITERMRANPAGFAAGGYDGIAHPSSGNAPSPDCSTTRCSAAELAAYDVYQWDARLSDRLPAGRGRIVCNESPCTPRSPRTVIIIWRESDRAADRDGATDQCASIDDVVDRCFRMVFRP